VLQIGGLHFVVSLGHWFFKQFERSQGVTKRKKGGVSSEPSSFELLKLVSEGIDDMVTVSAMEEERYVPTIFTSYNRATGLGGHPIRRMLAIHGKNQTGKSVLAAGIAESCRRMGHVPVIYEAEFSAEKRWLNRLVLGDGTLFKMPADLDELFSNIQTNLKNLAKGKQKGLIPQHTGCCFVIDTLTKLIPKEMYDMLIEKGIKKSYPLQAQWISLWTKYIVPQAYRSNSSFIIVLQERQVLDAGPFGKKRKPTLGEALLYDVSQRVECTHSKPVKEGGKIVASQFFYKMVKNKSDGWTDQEGSFFTSTGEDGAPPGFDIIREALEEAKLRKVLKPRKRNKRDYMVAAIEEEEPHFEIPGGTDDVREYLETQSNLDEFVEWLNHSARRLSS